MSRLLAASILGPIAGHQLAGRLALTEGSPLEKLTDACAAIAPIIINRTIKAGPTLDKRGRRKNMLTAAGLLLVGYTPAAIRAAHSHSMYHNTPYTLMEFARPLISTLVGTVISTYERAQPT